jgi:hypothetical protein
MRALSVGTCMLGDTRGTRRRRQPLPRRLPVRGGGTRRAGVASACEQLTSRYERRSVNVCSDCAWLIAWKSASMAMGITPGPEAALPSIVCVLPELQQ